jgi:hypothetical protein
MPSRSTSAEEATFPPVDKSSGRCHEFMESESEDFIVYASTLTTQSETTEVVVEEQLCSCSVFSLSDGAQRAQKERKDTTMSCNYSGGPTMCVSAAAV